MEGVLDAEPIPTQYLTTCHPIDLKRYASCGDDRAWSIASATHTIPPEIGSS
ncbi:MAG: hypothetical protein SWY16_20000 [Cyanobacteriota bacterium]|nr:hypothetical protein [Cyanobacteriota bacterium]